MKTTYLTRTIISYISISLISILVLTSIVVSIFMKQINKQLLDKEEQHLELSVASSQNLISSINDIAYQIYFNPKISKLSNYDDPTKMSEVLKEISNVSLSTRDIYDLLYINDYSPYIFSRETTYSYNTINEVYKFSNNLSIDHFKKINKLTVFESVTLDKFGDIKEITPIAFPDALNKFDKSSVIVFFIETNKLLPIFNDDNILMLTDSNNNILAKSNSAVHIKDFKNDNKYNTSEKGKYYTFKKFSPTLNLNYILLTPNEAINNIISNFMIVLILSVLFIIGISYLIIKFSLKYNYQPIKKLRESLENKTGKNYDDIDELKVIELSVNDLVDDMQTFTDFSSDNKSTFKEVLVTNVIQGGYDNVKYINSFQLYSKLYFNFDRFVVLSIYIDSNNKKDTFEILESLEKKSTDFDIYFKNSDNPFIFHAILCIGEYDYLEAVQSIKNELKDKGFDEIAIGVSEITRELSEMWKFYMQSVTALDFRLIKGSDAIIKFSEVNIETNNSLNDYPTQQIKSFGIFLEQGNVEKALSLIDEIFNLIKKNSNNLFMARCLCFDIIATMLKSVNAGKRITANTINIMKFDTVEQLIEASKEFCINEYMSKDNENFICDVAIEYIKNNYTHTDLSVKDIAEHLKISNSSLYNAFKQKLSVTPLQYINNLQIETVKEMLITTTLPVNIIIHKIGRYDVSNFIRKFRLQVGMTPGDYRKYYTVKSPKNGDSL